ncbi:MAG: dipeptide epimerase [Candidatus Korarchaeota archaeon]
MTFLHTLNSYIYVEFHYILVQIMGVSMEINKIEAYSFRIPLVEEFRIALGASVEHTGVIVKIYTDEGIIGLGEAAPSARITGETTETVLGVISKLKGLLLGACPLEYRRIIENIDNSIIGNPSAKAALDMAIFDIVAKKYNVPLYRLLGASENSFETSVTIGIMPHDRAIQKAQKYIEQGIRILKIKIGTNAPKDIELLKKIRQTVGDDIRIRIDANQGYTTKQAIRVLRAVEGLDIEFCEQPVHWRDIDGLREVRMHTEIPIMADESVHTPRDAIEVIKREAADMINIKIMKAGGILNALKIADICDVYGIKCQIGCMSETQIAIAAGVHVAVAARAIAFSDLDGYLFMKDQVALGIEFDGLKNTLPSKAGLGIELKEDTLKKYTISSMKFEGRK